MDNLDKVIKYHEDMLGWETNAVTELMHRQTIFYLNELKEKRQTLSDVLEEIESMKATMLKIKENVELLRDLQ